MNELHLHRILKFRTPFIQVLLTMIMMIPIEKIMCQSADASWAARWDTLSWMPEPTYAHAACAIEKKIYVLGGWRGHNDDGYIPVRNRIRVYDTETDSWEEVAVPHQLNRDHFSMIHIGGKIYVLGGSQGGNPRNSEYSDFSLDVWDPETNTWQARSNFPGDNLGAACALNNYIYVVGGILGPPGPIKTTYRYDILNDTWERMADMHKRRRSIGLVTIDGKLYAFGGVTQESPVRIVDRTVEIYDPATDSWTYGPSMMIGLRWINNNMVFSSQDNIFTFGGNSENFENVNHIYCFNLTTNAWSFIDSMPHKYLHFSAVKVADKIHLMGGGEQRVTGMFIWHTNISYDLSEFLPAKPESLRFGLHPNPASLQTRIRLNTEVAGVPDIALYNSMGQQVRYTIDDWLPAGKHDIPVDLSGLKAGIYFVVIRSDQVSSQVLIKE